MSSISAYGSGGSYTSPLQRLQQELANEVSAGTVSSSDESALSSALNDINSALTGGQSSPGIPNIVIQPLDQFDANAILNVPIINVASWDRRAAAQPRVSLPTPA